MGGSLAGVFVPPCVRPLMSLLVHLLVGSDGRDGSEADHHQAETSLSCVPHDEKCTAHRLVSAPGPRRG